MGLKVEDDPPSSGSVADADDSTDRLCESVTVSSLISEDTPPLLS